MFAEKVMQDVSRLPGTVGIYIATPQKPLICINEDVPVQAASVIKLMVMAQAYRQKEAGQIDFTSEITVHKENKLPSCGVLSYMHDGLMVEIGDLISLMIIVSDNTATNILIDLLGMENINRMIQSLEMKQTIMNRKLFMQELSRQGVQNYISAGDMGRFFQMLLRGEIVSKAASQEMLQHLKNQQLNGKMPFYLHSRDIICAHKTGEDEGITHDVGIIYTEQEPIVFCFVSENTDVQAAEETLQKLAAEVADVVL